MFPHGKHPGWHPDPLHEGSLVRTGYKTIIRSDVVYTAQKTKRELREGTESGRSKAKARAAVAIVAP